MEDLGLELKDTTMDMLGRAKSVKVTKENTTIMEDAMNATKAAVFVYDMLGIRYQ